MNVNPIKRFLKGRGTFIAELVRRDFVERFAGSILGSMWAFIWPLVNLFVYIVIFGKLMGARLPGSSEINAYGIYLAVGLIPWTCFANTIARTTSVFLDKKSVISKVQISLPSLLLFVNLSEVVTYIISMLILAVFLACNGFEINPRLIYLPFIFYLQQILALGIGTLTATLTVFFRDLKELVGVIMQLWFWFTPIVYVADILPPTVKKILLFNPVFPIIESYQRIIVFKDLPETHIILWLTVASHLLLLVAYKLFRILEKDVRDAL